MSNQYYENDDLELEVSGVTYTVDVYAKGTYSLKNIQGSKKNYRR